MSWKSCGYQYTYHYTDFYISHINADEDANSYKNPYPNKDLHADARANGNFYFNTDRDCDANDRGNGLCGCVVWALGTHLHRKTVCGRHHRRLWDCTADVLSDLPRDAGTNGDLPAARQTWEWLYPTRGKWHGLSGCTRFLLGGELD